VQIVPNATGHTTIWPELPGCAPSEQAETAASFHFEIIRVAAPSWVEPLSLVGLMPARVGLPGTALAQTEEVPSWPHQLWRAQPPDNNNNNNNKNNKFNEITISYRTGSKSSRTLKFLIHFWYPALHRTCMHYCVRIWCM